MLMEELRSNNASFYCLKKEKRSERCVEEKVANQNLSKEVLNFIFVV